MPTAENISTTESDSKTASRDALLIELGKRAREIEAWFDAQESVERPDTDDDPEYVAAIDQHGDVLTMMASLPAHTLDGLRAKAERIVFYRKGIPDDEPDTDGLFGFSIARDLITTDVASASTDK